MLHHILKVPNALAKCKGNVPPAYHQWYLKLYNSSKQKLHGKKRAANGNAIIFSDIKSNAPAVISICDCTDHMVDGGKKDAKIIINYSKQRLTNLIPQRYKLVHFSLTDPPMYRKQGRYCVLIFHG